tara:strand:+ start:1422 stop:2249 length:828 start_codon:yes stop_codon:yes gene_type:complete
MPRDTVIHYLKHHPRDALRVLEAARAEELHAFIDSLGSETKANVLGYLLPHTAAGYIARVGADRAAEVVSQLRSATAARVLAAVTQGLRRDILEQLPLEKRTNIRHLLRYPDDSVGALMLTSTLACRVDANVRRAKQLVRRFSQVELPMMVVVDDDMRPVGLVSVSNLLRARERDPIDTHMRFVPARLRAHAEVRTVLALPVWDTEDYVPVVETDERYVGLLPKASLHGHALATRGTAENSEDFATTVLDVADLFWRPAAETLARAASTNSGEHK